MNLRYHVWWFWHRFNPRALWLRATTYEVPVRINYGDQVSQLSYMRRRRWDRSTTEYEVAIRVRCTGDEDWQTIEATVYQDYGKRGRLRKISAYFDLPCDTTDVREHFYVDW